MGVLLIAAGTAKYFKLKFSDILGKEPRSKKQDPNKLQIRNPKKFIPEKLEFLFSNSNLIWFLRFGSWFLELLSLRQTIRLFVSPHIQQLQRAYFKIAAKDLHRVQ
jgi:hypothetical protein